MGLQTGMVCPKSKYHNVFLSEITNSKTYVNKKAGIFIPTFLSYSKLSVLLNLPVLSLSGSMFS